MTQVRILNSLIFIDLRWWCRRPVKMGRALKFKNLPHNRLLLSLAHGMGHDLKRFGNPDFCGDGGLPGL